MVKHSLQVLHMSYNDIGDDGITAIAGALGNSQIRELQVRRCNITLTGARSLGAALLVNNTVRKLLLIFNAITAEGARLIVQSAVDNGTCHTVWIDDEYDCYDEVKRLKNILRQRRQVGGCVV